MLNANNIYSHHNGDTVLESTPLPSTRLRTVPCEKVCKNHVLCNIIIITWVILQGDTGMHSVTYVHNYAYKHNNTQLGVQRSYWELCCGPVASKLVIERQHACQLYSSSGNMFER